MSEAVLYQSVLQKLGQLSPQKLVELDAFLAVLVKKQTKGVESVANGKNPVDQYFGAWKDWDDEEFQSFLGMANVQDIKKPKFGFGKYKVEISDDFDAPLEDFKDESIAG